MNERIKERIKEIAEKAIKDMPGAWDIPDEFCEKFTKLIAGHAINCVRDVLRDENSDLSYGAASQVQKHLGEFFGVEE